MFKFGSQSRNVNFHNCKAVTTQHFTLRFRKVLEHRRRRSLKPLRVQICLKNSGVTFKWGRTEMDKFDIRAHYLIGSYRSRCVLSWLFTPLSHDPFMEGPKQLWFWIDYQVNPTFSIHFQAHSYGQKLFRKWCWINSVDGDGIRVYVLLHTVKAQKLHCHHGLASRYGQDLASTRTVH